MQCVEYGKHQMIREQGFKKTGAEALYIDLKKYILGFFFIHYLFNSTVYNQLTQESVVLKYYKNLITTCSFSLREKQFSLLNNILVMRLVKIGIWCTLYYHTGTVCSGYFVKEPILQSYCIQVFKGTIIYDEVSRQHLQFVVNITT